MPRGSNVLRTWIGDIRSCRPGRLAMKAELLAQERDVDACEGVVGLHVGLAGQVRGAERDRDDVVRA